MYIFDLEGTLSNCDHRIHLLPTQEQKDELKREKGQYKDLYLPFHAEFLNDTVNENVKLIYDACLHITHTVILTGMMEKHRQDAQEWLLRNGISYDDLIMRPNDDFRSSEDYKLDWINRCGNICHMAFDDRQKIVNHFLANGIPAVLVKGESNDK